MNRQTDKDTSKIVALYVRLSRDDENEGDSNSIAHQIEILTKYATDHNITNYKIYKDDGYSGTNFNRPGFQKMLSDIEAGAIGMVIVKDMSRFGRNYLEVGLYTEIRFPEMGVRFVAVNDGVDSENAMDNDFTPFRNIINEWYAKDTSKKIRAVLRAKGMSGERLNAKLPYGYIMGENGRLVIDEETAPIVKQIFRWCAEGNGTGKIARMLTEREIPTPGTIEFRRTGHTYRYNPDYPCHWSPTSVVGILGNDVYLGQTTNFKTTKISYKNKKAIINPPEKRVTFENTHEAIIDRNEWNLVRKMREQRRRPTRLDEVALFSGMLFCADCGTRLRVQRSRITSTESLDSYVCGKYKGKGAPCTSHYIRSLVLEELVLQNLQRIAAYALTDGPEFMQQVLDEKMALKRAEREKGKRKLEKLEHRINELDGIIQKLYEDKVGGALTNERFAKLSAGYEKEQADLTKTAEGLREALNAADTEAVNVESFMRVVQKYAEPTELTPTLLHELVDKIIVHEVDKSSGQRVQQIDIHYNFIGEINLSPEYSRGVKQYTPAKNRPHRR